MDAEVVSAVLEWARSLGPLLGLIAVGMFCTSWVLRAALPPWIQCRHDQKMYYLYVEEKRIDLLKLLSERGDVVLLEVANEEDEEGTT